MVREIFNRKSVVLTHLWCNSCLLYHVLLSYLVVSSSIVVFRLSTHLKKYKQPGRKPASRAPRTSRTPANWCQWFTKPKPIMVKAQVMQMTEKNTRGPIKRMKIVTGISKIIAVGKKSSDTMEYRIPKLSWRSRVMLWKSSAQVARVVDKN